MNHLKGWRDLIASERGNFAMITAICLVPIALAVGFVIDYNGSINTKSSMQNALDAAVLSAVSETNGQASKVLAEVYAANGGSGTVKIDSISTEGGVTSVTGSAAYDRPTTFMRLANVEETNVDVTASARRKTRLVEITFTLDYVKGWFSKAVTLYGKRVGETQFSPLAQIDYQFNGDTSSDGLGTTILYKLGGASPVQMAKQTCNGPEETSCVPRNAFEAGKATIDVSDMDELYLDMTTSGGAPWREYRDAGFPTTVKTSDPKYAYYLLIDGVQTPKNKPVNLFDEIPCGRTSYQAWEDGGTVYWDKTTKLEVNDTDFRYKVDGRCGFPPGNQGAVLTK